MTDKRQEIFNDLIYLEGKAAYGVGRDVIDNPYATEMQSSNPWRWEWGWLDGLAMDVRKLMEESA